MKRRTFIATTGALATVSFAGCPGEGGPGAENATDLGTDLGTDEEEGLLDGTPTPGDTAETSTDDGFGDETPTDDGVTEGPGTETDDPGTGTDGPGTGTDGPGTGTDGPDGTNGGTPDDGPILEDVAGEVTSTPTNLVVEDHQLIEFGGELAVMGTVHNRGTAPYEYVDVEVTLYDDDQQVGAFGDSSETELDSIGPDETWRFIVDLEDQTVSQSARYEIAIAGVLDEDER